MSVKSANFLQKLGLPEDVLSSVPTVELTGDRRVLVQGCHGVLLYTEEEVCLNLKTLQLSIKGESLSLASVGEGMVQVDGTIRQVEYS